MKDAAPQPVRLAEYTPPNWLIDEVHLTFELDPKRTRVSSKIAFRPNPKTRDRTFRLDGEELQLIRAMVDGKVVDPRLDDTGLSLVVPDAPFLWECEVEINPESNTALEGLYMSRGLFCTQCEAEGFRKITYYPDRPDVMAPFTVRLESELPVLMSNGNPVASGPGWAEWHDPWPKPSYLFALVAGDLVALSGRHQTADGRDVALNIWVRPGDEDRCAYALDALQRSMVWDEEVYGRNYDLEEFNLVAIDDFNAGAMENKGLNIFNSSYVLASPATATDTDYEWIESVVAHEYFHNWTGNRITCRDWFQLSLKEGLTVFRDQQFSGDMRGHAMKRIGDVQRLRARQFREDAGPLAHPVRPEEYIAIDNFYTATVYEKGAEVIAMLKAIVGDDGYAKALGLYFDRHDGQACTIEDWLQVFEEATGQDLTQFKLWYSQAGTPRVKIATVKEGDQWVVKARQSIAPTPGQPEKMPVPIPIKLALFDENGAEIAGETTVTLATEQAVIARANTPERPIVSALRGFSAPVILDQDLTMADRLVLLAHDTDPFNKWEAGRAVAKEQLTSMVTEGAEPAPAFLDALGHVISDEALDPAFRAFALGLPSNEDMAQSFHASGRTPDPDKIYSTHQDLLSAIANTHADTFVRLFEQTAHDGPYTPDAAGAGRRALRLKALEMITRTDGPGRAVEVFDQADNMTESLGALGILLRHGAGSDAAAVFFERWKDDPNALDKWFSVQIACAAPEETLGVAERLTALPEFTWKSPNRFRAVIGAFSGNFAGFHQASGEGYRFFAKWLQNLDSLNPMTTARMATRFETVALFDGDRQSLMRDAMAGLVAGTPSKNLAEVINRILGD